MAWELPKDVYSLESAVDLSASQFKFVKMNGALVVAVAAVTDKALGVLQNKPGAVGAGSGIFTPNGPTTAQVCVGGVSRVKTAAAYPAGSVVYLASDGSVSTTAQAGQCVGILLTASSGAAAVASILLKPLGSVV